MQITRTGWFRGLAIALAPAVVAVGAVVVVPTATAEPTKTIQQVQAELDDLEMKAEAASEALNGAQLALTAVKKKQAAAQKQVDAATAQLKATQALVGEIAAGAYRSGGIDSSLQLLLADDPQQFLAQAAALDQVARSQSSVLRRTQTAGLRLAQAMAALQQQKDAAAKVEAEMAQHKAEIDKSVSDQRTLLSHLKAEERARLLAIQKAEREKAAREAAAAAQRLAAQQRSARAAVRQDSPTPNTRPNGDATSGRDTGNGGGNGGGAADNGNSGNSGGNGNSGGGSGNGGSSDSGGSSGGGSGSGGGGGGAGGASTAVSAALAQVGEPYSYSAHPPTSWDCSKLVSYAWRQAGVSLTAYSRAMAGEVRRISRSELRPGDILFYFNGAHHVAMYIGGGMIVEASSPRTGVRVTSAWNSWSARHFSFAGRPVG